MRWSFSFSGSQGSDWNSKFRSILLIEKYVCMYVLCSLKTNLETLAFNRNWHILQFYFVLCRLIQRKEYPWDFRDLLEFAKIRLARTLLPLNKSRICTITKNRLKTERQNRKRQRKTSINFNNFFYNGWSIFIFDKLNINHCK